MKTESEVRARLRLLITDELKRRIAEGTRRLPHVCKYHHQQPLDVRRLANGQSNPNYNRITQGPGVSVDRTLGLCMYGSENATQWSGTVCEEEIDAKTCSMFQPVRTKEEIWRQFLEDMMQPSWLREHLPEGFVLMWVLGILEVPQIPWWLKIWYKLRRFQWEPLSPKVRLPLLGKVLSEDPSDADQKPA